jgi:hypothetical protein
MGRWGVASPRFSPHRQASRARTRVTAFLLGPVLWVVALVVVGLVISRTDLLLLGALIAAGSFLLAALWLLIVRRLRIAQERDGSVPR